ncbi:MAG: serine/threonine protein kinase [Burkholderiales bacterium]|nr:MAG: serine/threonine protein kinase [Burkholderiales bacterium]
MSARPVDRWRVLSPLLDELLDLDAGARDVRLAQLAAQDPALAEELRALLARDESLNDLGFMERPVAEALQLAPAPAIVEGMTIGPYRLERELGQGGMGSVWIAVRADGRFEGRVAVKFLRSGLFAAGDAGRFAREGQILARLAHPNIARLLDAGVVDAQPYLVLEYVDGQPIDGYCRERGLGIEARVRLFLDVLSAVGHAHARLILHRDLKPSNILVTAGGEVKLLDFGIAKLLDEAGRGDAGSELTQLAGHAYTPHYAAPEQVQQTEVTTATDVYALGVLLYQLLGGGHPTAADTQMRLDLLKAVVEQVPRRLSDAAAQGSDPSMAREARALRGDVDTIVAKALKKLPADRYGNAQALADDLRRWLAHEPISARPDRGLYVLGRFVRRHRWPMAAGTVAVLALVALTAVSAIQARRASAAEQMAQARRQQAESLLSYLLGEMASQLRPVGRLSLLESIGQQALEVLGTAEPAAGASVDDLLKRVKALLMVAEVNLKKERFGTAADALAAAQRWLDEARRLQPDDEGVLRQGTQLAFWWGELAQWQGRPDETRRHWTAYRDIAQQWVRRQPTSDEALLELSSAQSNLGILALRALRLPEAASLFSVALDSSRQLYRRNPAAGDFEKKLNDDLIWAVEVAVVAGRANDGLVLNDELALLQDKRLAARPGDLVPKVDRAIGLWWRAQALELLDRARDAAQARGQSLALLQEAAAGEPKNQRWRRYLLEREVQHLLLPLVRDTAAHADLKPRVDALQAMQANLTGTPSAIVRNLLGLWQSRQQPPTEALALLDQLLALPPDWAPSAPRPRYTEMTTRAYLEAERWRLSRVHRLPLPQATCTGALAYWAPVFEAGVAGPVPDLWRQIKDCS